MPKASLTAALCIRGTQAEFAGRPDEAAACYQQAWEVAGDDYDACLAAHYLARCQPTAADELQWNQIALDRAQSVTDGRVQGFYPSLYLNLGRSYEKLGDHAAAQGCYARAAALGFPHQPEV
jgi:tetratricopeptide (TPR) repeat protein